LKRVEGIKNCSRRLSLTSDIIVGFPGETEADFEATMKLVETCQYDALYIFKYSKRSGTPAAQLEDVVPETEKKVRFMALEELQTSIQSGICEGYIGRSVSVLVEKQSARSEDDLTGHSTCHKVVNFKAPQTHAGEVVDVLITEAKPNSLYGVLQN
jgi:tRNA-2-methylthio-N6-dimethylallyladenosine synthase